jgi:hypothetical protein
VGSHSGKGTFEKTSISCTDQVSIRNSSEASRQHTYLRHTLYLLYIYCLLTFTPHTTVYAIRFRNVLSFAVQLNMHWKHTGCIFSRELRQLQMSFSGPRNSANTTPPPSVIWVHRKSNCITNECVVATYVSGLNLQ